MSQTRDSYCVRQFEPRDRAGFESLYEVVFGERRGEEWFDWKYRENPFVDHVPVVVAIDGDDRVVGARPLFALSMAAGGERFLALQPGDTMVHPDHRRQGLFTRMTEHTIERYDDHEAALFFNFPNEQSGAGYRKLGWRDVGPVATYYRVQSPSAWLDGFSRAGDLAGRAADAVADGYYRLREMTASSSDGIAVEGHRTPPADLLETLYRSAIPGGFHAVRSRRYVRWRFRNPRWTYRTYVARDASDRALAAVVTGSKSSDGRSVTRVTDVIPPGADETALAALLAALLDDHAADDTVAAPPCLADSLASQFGFRSDEQPPLSLASSTTTLVARPAAIDPSDWTLAGRSLIDMEEWTLTFGEQDTS
jgi:GNAT superfamily N-acetyltransferase